MPKFGTHIGTHQLRGYISQKLDASARVTCTTAKKSPCYISTTTWTIVIKFGTHIEGHQLRVWISQKGIHPHVRTCQLRNASKNPLAIPTLTIIEPIVLKFGMHLETELLNRFIRARSFIAQ